jgi:hypothetical protein
MPEKKRILRTMYGKENEENYIPRSFIILHQVILLGCSKQGWCGGREL